MYKLFERISNNLANKIVKEDYKKKKLNSDLKTYNNEIGIVSYSVFGILCHLFILATIILIGVVFNILIPMLIVSLTYVVLRTKAGGYHCEKPWHCFFTSNSIAIVGGLLALLTQNRVELMLLISTMCGIWIIPYAPKPSKNSPSKGVELDCKFRKRCGLFLIVLMLFNYMFAYANMNLLSTSIGSGIIVTCFVVSDSGEKMLNWFWRKFL